MTVLARFACELQDISLENAAFPIREGSKVMLYR